MDYVRIRVHSLVKEARGAPKTPNRIHAILMKVFVGVARVCYPQRLFEDVNHAMPTEVKKEQTSQSDSMGEAEQTEAGKEGANEETVENDDFLVEAPSLFFAVMW